MYSVLILLAVTVVSINAVNDEIFYPFGDGDKMVPPGDAASSQVRVNISTGFPFMYDNQTTAFVSINWF